MSRDLYCETPMTGIVRLHPLERSTMVEVHWMNEAGDLEKCMAKQWLLREGWIEAAHIGVQP